MELTIFCFFVLVVNYQGILYNECKRVNVLVRLTSDRNYRMSRAHEIMVTNHRNGGRYYAEHESGYWMAGIDHYTSCD